jgi:hypothetical protein
LNALNSNNGPLFLGGSLGFRSEQYKLPTANIINPIILTVHGNPIFGINCLAIVGYTSPPVALPDAMIATATLLFLLKYVVTRDIVGAN